jgi:hypothetical protein
MARKPAVSVVDQDGNPVPNVVEDGQVTVFNQDPTPEEDTEPLQRAAQELGASGDAGRVEVWRVKRSLAGSQEAFLGAMELEECSVPEVQRRFGGGEFRIRIRRQNGKLYKQETKIIEGEPITPRAPAPPTVIAAPQDHTEGAVMRALGEIMRQNQEFLITLKQSLQPAAPPKTTIEMAQELLALKSLFIDPNAPRADPFAMLTQTIGLIKETGILEGGGGGGQTTEMDLFKTLIEKFGPAFMEGVKRDAPALPQSFNPALPPSGMAPQAQPNPIPNRSANPNPPQPEDAEMNRIKMALNFLAIKAGEGADPDLYAEMVLDNAPEDDIKMLFSNPQWFDQLAAVAPAIRNHVEWFTKLRASIEQQLTEEQAPVNPSPDETAT